MLAIKAKIKPELADDLASRLEGLSAEQLSALIGMAAELRALLKPWRTKEPPQGPQIAIVDPRWAAGKQNETTVLQIQHPGLGWLTFIIPADSRDELIRALTRQARGDTTWVQ